MDIAITPQMIKGDLTSVRSISLIGLSLCGVISDRTSCAIMKAGENLPLKNIGEIIDAGSGVVALLSTSTGFPEFAVNELVAYVQSLVEGSSSYKNGSVIPHGSNLQCQVSYDLLNKFRSVSMEKLVNSFDLSARLKNRMPSRNFPFHNIGEVLDAGEAVLSQVLKIRDISLKTAKEFCALIKTLYTKNSGVVGIEPRIIQRETFEPSSVKLGSPELRSKTLKSLVSGHPISTRIKTCINSKGFPFATVSELLDAGDMALSSLLNVKHIGLKSAKELLAFVQSFLVRSTPSVSIENNRKEIATIISKEFPGMCELSLAEYLDGKADVIASRRLESRFHTMLNLPTERKELLRLCFRGITLEHVGKRYGLSRERVRQIYSKYSGWFDDKSSPHWARQSLNKIMVGNHLPSLEELMAFDRDLPSALINHFAVFKGGQLTPERRLEIAKALNLDVDPELAVQTKWTIDRLVYELKQFANKLGSPTMMPLQKEMKEQGRSDLHGAIGKFGGQSKVAKLAGLSYQGQLVAPDGSRTYWTDERVGAFLKEVAKKEGIPGRMPSQKAVCRYAPNPATIISNLTGSSRLKGRGPISWYALSKKYGLRYCPETSKVTQIFIKSFVKSLGDSLFHLSPAEIYVLFEQHRIGKAGVNTYRKRSFDLLVEAIQSGRLPREEIKKWLKKPGSATVDILLDPNCQTIEEAFHRSGIKPKNRASVQLASAKGQPLERCDLESQLPIPSAGETLKALKKTSHLISESTSDEDAIKFLIAKAADKLWKRCFVEEDACVKQIAEHKGNTYSQTARDAFLNEYRACTEMPIPDGYTFHSPSGKPLMPKLMQMLIAHRVLTRKRVLNLSGTGTGKTLSAILASRVINARLTLITCPNATVAAWKNAILCAFPESEVVTKPESWNPCWRNSSILHYVVVNHEMIQDCYEEAINRFIEQNRIDLVVIDELHQVKQRNPHQESQRRRLLSHLLNAIPDGRPAPAVLGMSATPIINNLFEGRSLVELVTGLSNPDIEIKPTIENCMKMFQTFTTLGFRMIPKFQVSREPKIYPIDASGLLPDLLALGPHPHPQKVEALLLRVKFPVIKQNIRKKTVIFTEYVAEMVEPLAAYLTENNLSFGVYTGDSKDASEPEYSDALQQFLKGETDVLIASIRTLATGVDGLQFVSNNVIFASLPWTSTDYDQAIGRFDREGFVFDELDIHIPRTYIRTSSGTEWSWCDARLRRLQNKRDIARAAVDGEIPDSEGQLTPAKATEYWLGWLKRVNENDPSVKIS